MDNIQVETNNIADFSTVTNVGDAIDLWKITLDKIFENNPGGSKIAVSVVPTDAGGSYTHYDMYVYDSYTNALDMLNKLEYERNTAVSVIEMNRIGYSYIMDKCYNGNGYSRLAQVAFHRWDNFDAPKMWRSGVGVYVVKYRQYV